MRLGAAKVETNTGLPAGVLHTLAFNSSIPTGWLLCEGQAVSRTTYAALFGVVGTMYGVGDGSTTFNLPDLRARYVRGHDAGRGVDSGRPLGSYQDAQTQAHTHAGTGLSVGTVSTPAAHTHAVAVNSNSPHTHTHSELVYQNTLMESASSGTATAVRFISSGPVSMGPSSPNLSHGHSLTGLAISTVNAPHSHTITGQVDFEGGPSSPAVPVLNRNSLRPRNVALRFIIKH